MAKSVGSWEDLAKIKKALPTGFEEEADQMKEDQLRNCIVESEHNLRTEIAKFEDNEEFLKLKEKYKEAAAPLRDAKKCQTAKIRYCLHRLEEIGKI